MFQSTSSHVAVHIYLYMYDKRNSCTYTVWQAKLIHLYCTTKESHIYVFIKFDKRSSYSYIGMLNEAYILIQYGKRSPYIYIV